MEHRNTAWQVLTIWQWQWWSRATPKGALSGTKGPCSSQTAQLQGSEHVHGLLAHQAVEAHRGVGGDACRADSEKTAQGRHLRERQCLEPPARRPDSAGAAAALSLLGVPYRPVRHHATTPVRLPPSHTPAHSSGAAPSRGRLLGTCSAKLQDRWEGTALLAAMRDVPRWGAVRATQRSAGQEPGTCVPLQASTRRGSGWEQQCSPHCVPSMLHFTYFLFRT